MRSKFRFVTNKKNPLCIKQTDGTESLSIVIDKSLNLMKHITVECYKHSKSVGMFSWLKNLYSEQVGLTGVVFYHG